MTEMGELSVEDELRDELRTVRHDLEHVTHQRDELAAKFKRVEEILREYDYGTEYAATYDETGGAASALYDIAVALGLEQP